MFFVIESMDELAFLLFFLFFQNALFTFSLELDMCLSRWTFSLSSLSIWVLFRMRWGGESTKEEDDGMERDGMGL